MLGFHSQRHNPGQLLRRRHFDPVPGSTTDLLSVKAGGGDVRIVYSPLDAVKQAAETLLVSRNGGVLRLTEKLFPGQEITLHRQLEGDQSKSVRARIMAEIDREGEGFLYAIAILEPRVDFWDIEFPAVHKSEEALARMLMECSFCQRREVVYLNEMELKSFEIRRCIARLCRHWYADAYRRLTSLRKKARVF